MIKNVKIEELNIKIATLFLNVYSRTVTSTAQKMFPNKDFFSKCDQIFRVTFNKNCCNKNYQQKFDKKLKRQFFNIYKFSYHDKDESILLLRKWV